MKQFILFFLVMGSHIMSAAQNNSQSATVEFNGAKYPCEMMEYAIPPDDMEMVIKNQMRAAGYQPEKTRQFLVYRNVKMEQMDGGQPRDLIFKVESKSRKEKGISIVYLITAKPGEIPDGKVKGAKGLALVSTYSGAGSILTGYRPAVETQAHNLAVLAQADVIAKAQKKLEKLKKEQANLEKKIKEFQDDLAANQKEQENQITAIEVLNKQMEELKSKAPGQ